MYPLSAEKIYRFNFVKLWSLLAFQAGFVNSFGFLACGRFVSHVTGYGTQVGLAFGQKKPWLAFEMFLGLAFFIFGSFVNSYFTVAAKERGRKPAFLGVILSLPLIYLFAAVVGRLGLFGNFGEDFVLTRDYALLLLLSFACGLQNGCFAAMTGGAIRTTHLTGLSTDLGIDFARIWVNRKNPGVIFKVKRANDTRLVILCSFAIGAIFSAIFSSNLQYDALFIPACTSFAIYFAMMIELKKLEAEANAI